MASLSHPLHKIPETLKSIEIILKQNAETFREGFSEFSERIRAIIIPEIILCWQRAQDAFL